MDDLKTGETADVSTVSPRWTGVASIELVRQLNDQCIELLCQLAADSLQRELPQFVLQNRDLWRLLEAEARNRVAAFPFVIVDLRFKDTESWLGAAMGHLMSPSDSIPYTGLPPKFFEDLVLETLLFARQTAREDFKVVKAMFAMTSPVATRIASLTLPQVRTIAFGSSEHLRVRWDNNPDFWRDLLIACRSGHEEAMSAVRRQGKLLFCGELIESNT